MNTQGSGKTRLVLEALCVRWGLYFVCQKTDYGSSDLHLSVTQRLFHNIYFQTLLPEASDEEYAIRRDINHAIATRQASLVMLARLLMLKWFLACSNMSESISDEKAKYLRKRWLLLQLFPNLLDRSGYGDVFNDLVCLLDSADYPQLLSHLMHHKMAATTQITGDQLVRVLVQLKRSNLNLDANVTSLLEEIAVTLAGSFGSTQSRLVIAVDEAQYGVKRLLGAFESGRSDTKTGQRPVLHQIAQAWDLDVPHEIKPQFIFSGEDLGLKYLPATENPTIFQPKEIEVVFNTGAFESKEDMRSYMSMFVPEDLMETRPWRELLRRCSYWLRGRYVTAFLGLNFMQWSTDSMEIDIVSLQRLFRCC